MNHQVRSHMARQRGLITRQQAVASGMSPSQVDRRVAKGTWVVVRRGVYAEASYADLLTSVRQRRLQADRAASLRIRAPHAMSHASAAYLLDLPILHPRPALTHVTRPGVIGAHIRHGVKHHLAPFRRDQLVSVDGVWALGAARTAVDITREHGFLPGLVAADSALRLGVSLSQLRAVREGMDSWPYATVIDDVLSSASVDTDSIGETLTRHLVIGLGFGVPQVQFGLTANGRTAWCDLRLGRHVFEFDGRAKYRRAETGGFARDAPEDVLWEEKQRQDWIAGFKLGVSRVVWDELFGAARELTAVRLTREYLDTCQRFGTETADLAQYRPRGPRPRATEVLPFAA